MFQYSGRHGYVSRPRTGNEESVPDSAVAGSFFDRRLRIAECMIKIHSVTWQDNDACFSTLSRGRSTAEVEPSVTSSTLSRPSMTMVVVPTWPWQFLSTRRMKCNSLSLPSKNYTATSRSSSSIPCESLTRVLKIIISPSGIQLLFLMLHSWGSIITSTFRLGL